MPRSITAKHRGQIGATSSPLGWPPNPSISQPCTLRGMLDLLAPDAFTLTYSGAQIGKDPHPSML